MKQIGITLFFIFFTSSLSLFAQEKDSTKYKQIQFFKINQENDLFTLWNQSDKYYTDGINMEFANSIFNNKPADFMLFGFKTKYKDFSLAINQDMYVPENTDSPKIDSTDRPYAGQLYFTYAQYSNQFWKGRKLVSKIFLGVQGPSAGGKELQQRVHEVLDSKDVLGWDHQIANGLILDYQVQYLQLLPLSTPITELHYFVTGRTGTLNTSLDVGFRFKFGRFTDTYTNFYGIHNPDYTYNITEKDFLSITKSRSKMIPKHIRKKNAKEQVTYLNNKLNRKFQFYFFTEGNVKYLLRNGSVEGSLVQFQTSDYTYSYSDYEHFSLGGRYGFVMQYSHAYLEFARYLHTDTFREDGYFGYGRVILSWVF